jgi:hypothetical protein
MTDVDPACQHELRERFLNNLKSFDFGKAFSDGSGPNSRFEAMETLAQAEVATRVGSTLRAKKDI